MVRKSRMGRKRMARKSRVVRKRMVRECRMVSEAEFKAGQSLFEK